MTNAPTSGGRVPRNSKRIRVTAQTDEQSTARPAQILRSAALQKALLEAEAEAEHARALQSCDLPTSEGPSYRAGEEARRA